MLAHRVCFIHRHLGADHPITQRVLEAEASESAREQARVEERAQELEAQRLKERRDEEVAAMYPTRKRSPEPSGEQRPREGFGELSDLIVLLFVDICNSS